LVVKAARQGGGGGFAPVAAAWARRRRQHGRVSGDDSGEDGARSDENNIQRFRVKAHRRRHDAIGEQKN
jgi:hypothetical protein